MSSHLGVSLPLPPPKKVWLVSIRRRWESRWLCHFGVASGDDQDETVQARHVVGVVWMLIGCGVGRNCKERERDGERGRVETVLVSRYIF